MFEKVNPAHPDKVADRIAGAMVDLAYRKKQSTENCGGGSHRTWCMSYYYGNLRAFLYGGSALYC